MRFNIHNSIGKCVSLIVCFSLLIILVFGSFFSFSSFHLLDEAVAADDMMGGPMGGGSSDGGGSDGGGSDNGGSGGGDQDQGPESGGGGSGGNSESGGGGERGRDNQGGEGSTTGPKAVDKGKCEDGNQYDEFGNCIKAQVAQNPGNDKPTVPTSTTCLVSYNQEESGQSSVWGMKNEQLMKIHPGVFYYTVDHKRIQQQLSLFHQVQGMQLGKTYDLSSYSGTECNINQVRNNDGSITATITYPNSPGKQVIKTDATGKVPVQINYLGYNDKIYSSEAIDNNGIATKFRQDVGGISVRGLNSIETTEPGGTRPIVSVVSDSKDGSVKILGRGALGPSSVGRHELQDDNDGDPTVATTKSGMKVTVTPFNVAYPQPDPRLLPFSNELIDPLTTIDSNRLVFRITNDDSSVKTHMIINPDGSVQPGSKWTTPAPVEPANE